MQEDGSILGDPDHVDITSKILELGWKKEPRTEFDVLPIVVQIDGKAPKYFEIPPEGSYSTAPHTTVRSCALVNKWEAHLSGALHCASCAN